MARLNSGELRELLERDLPGALAAPHSPPQAAEAHGEEENHPVLQEHDAVVVAERLPDVARYLRDQLGYSYLSHITAVDYLREGLIEVVYFFYHPEGGGPQIVRVRVPRDNAVIPSITPFWPGANLQEREAYDLFGVHFPGHPFLRRVYLWDEFEGYPMRKDFPKTGDKYTHVTGGEE
ncbi:MAG: NADH-quinone oxidoreductase [Herpetosiphonaceae bacterium]|nr:MAG: NADH-quinone oxidoreductase [Herpetosiphonaceae bacterium]